MAEAAADEFRTVAWVYNPADFAILFSVLQSAGIFVAYAGRGHASVDPGLVTALGGIAIRVHHEDAEDARALLAGHGGRWHRVRPLFGFWPVNLLFFLVVGYLGMSPPPRQVPAFAAPAIA